jgi:nitroreductase
MQLSLGSIEKRISVRSYDGSPIGEEEAVAIRTAFDECAPGPFGGRPRFVLLGQGEAGLGGESRAGGADGAGGGAKIGSYGFIKAAPAFIVGAIADGPFANEDFGYCLEGVVLRATELGLGTCWLGGSFSRGKAAAAVALGAGEIMPCVSPVGRAAERRSLIDRVVRSSAKGDNRKPAAELFFDGDFRTPLGAAGNYGQVLEAVRRAPSASNKQPWRILRAGTTGDRVFHLYLAEDRIYNSALGAVKMQDVDMGIAMRHFEVAARSLGLPGSWRRLDADPLQGNSPFGYIATWQA